MYSYDIAVIGGGFTGVAAAIAAAREGLSAIIIEASGALGGSATNCLVNPFMKYAVEVEDADGKPCRKEVNKGIFAEIRKRLFAMGGMFGENQAHFDEEKLKVVLDRMCAEAGVTVLFHATLCDAVCEDGRITEIKAITKAGKLSFAAKFFIDCAGDADLSVMCGFPFRLGRDEDHLCQPMTLCFRVINVDGASDFLANSRDELQKLYKEFQAAGKIKNPRENILLFHHLEKNVVHFNSTRVVKLNPTDPFDVSKAEAIAREQAYELFDFMRENSPYFKNAHLMQTAASIGVRESRMIDGEYLLCADDILECRSFDDSIAAGCYEIDIHNPSGSGTVIKSIPKGKYYHIPYRCLIPKGSRNLLVAGRTISTTHEAQSAYRVIPIVCCIGEGAGIAAAVACKSGVDVKCADMAEIHGILDKNNCVY